MTRRWIPLALAIGLLPVCSSSSSAACRTYFGGESDMPREAMEILRYRSNGAAEICSGKGDYRYYYVFKVQKGELGVCRYTKLPLFQSATTNSALRWVETPPLGSLETPRHESYMALRNGDCPSQQDSHYVRTFGVSEGVFRELARFWASMAASERGFDAVIDDSRLSQEYRRLSQELKSVLLPSNGSDGRASWISVALQGESDLVGLPHYTLWLRHPKTVSPHFPYWLLEVDLDDHGVKLLGIAQAID